MKEGREVELGVRIVAFIRGGKGLGMLWRWSGMEAGFMMRERSDERGFTIHWWSGGRGEYSEPLWWR